MKAVRELSGIWSFGWKINGGTPRGTGSAGFGEDEVDLFLSLFFCLIYLFLLVY